MATVLVVDDVPDYARLLGLELRKQGYEVELAFNGATALDYLASHAIDAVLLDVVMPGMNGLELCRRLKSDERLRSIPVIMVTALDSQDDQIAGLDAGADDYISRHCDRRVLAARLRTALRLKSSLDLLRDMNQRLDESRRVAEAANTAKSEFLANFSHELRTPMTSILGFAEMLRENSRSDEELASIDTIKRNGELLLNIVNELLDLSKIEAGRFTIELGPCSPRAIINDVMALMKLRAEAKGIALGAAFEGPLPDLIHTDALRLRQILVNLVANAIKFTEQGGVLVSLRRLDSEKTLTALQFEVADTGIGIAADRVDVIFRPYAQADASVSRRFGGTGLGLTISRRLAQLLGGEITVTSSPGVGSTFCLTIPANLPTTKRAAADEFAPIMPALAS